MLGDVTRIVELTMLMIVCSERDGTSESELRWDDWLLIGVRARARELGQAAAFGPTKA